jgi:osmoprotectant transport system permease protein
MSDFVDGFHFVFNNGSLLWDKVQTHLLISAEALVISVVIGVPLGMFLGHLHRFSFLAINVSNIGRALPSLAVLAVLLPVFGIGRVNVIIALVVLGFPPILTNSYVAVDQVDADTVDAAKGIGLKPSQVLSKVEMPLALPLIFAGIRTAAVFIVATATLAGIFGGGGLGDIINDRETYGLAGIIGAAYVLIVLAFAAQAVFIGLERLVTPTGLRRGRAASRSTLRRRQTQVLLNQAGAEEEEPLGIEEPQLEQGRTT